MHLIVNILTLLAILPVTTYFVFLWYKAAQDKRVTDREVKRQDNPLNG